jgi:hypothetical protein
MHDGMSFIEVIYDEQNSLGLGLKFTLLLFLGVLLDSSKFPTDSTDDYNYLSLQVC